MEQSTMVELLKKIIVQKFEQKKEWDAKKWLSLKLELSLKNGLTLIDLKIFFKVEVKYMNNSPKGKNCSKNKFQSKFLKRNLNQDFQSIFFFHTEMLNENLKFNIKNWKIIFLHKVKYKF